MPETGFLHRSNNLLQYMVYVPRGVDPHGLPAILFMHGSGESGTDGQKQIGVGLGHAAIMDPARWPFLIVMPQKPVTKSLWLTYREGVDQVLAEVEKEFQPDPHRRYITGLSQGGRGTWDLATRLHWTFAAAAPVCGWTEADESVPRLRNMPLWAFHGADDDIVKPEASAEAVRKLKALGSEATFTLYEGVNHNSWDKAYKESELPTWLLKHSTH